MKSIMTKEEFLQKYRSTAFVGDTDDFQYIVVRAMGIDTLVTYVNRIIADLNVSRLDVPFRPVGGVTYADGWYIQTLAQIQHI